MALAVEVIKTLWSQGLYRNNKILKRIVAQWFDVWVEWKTIKTMEDVDEQIKDLNPEPVQFHEAVSWEEEHGETPLGGPMGITHEFTDHNT